MTEDGVQQKGYGNGSKVMDHYDLNDRNSRNGVLFAWGCLDRHLQQIDMIFTLSKHYFHTHVT